jgi:ubiquinone/menaquinone biosynthesis C-methylase UbiE
MDEIEKIKIRYRYRRTKEPLYSPLLPSVYMAGQEKERALIKWIRTCGIDTSSKKILEIGCGTGGNLLQFIHLGFLPENLIGNELIDERVKVAATKLPTGVNLYPGDACNISFPENYVDIVYQSTVFTSILSDDFQKKLAEKMWGLIKPGGGVLWYDFIYNNPANSDVRGIKISKIKELFPEGKYKIWKITLAPPINRTITKFHPSFYHLFNFFPILRTHVLCWINKL